MRDPIALPRAYQQRARRHANRHLQPGANQFVTSLALQPDGKIVVGGYFTALGGQPRSYIGRLFADGNLDSIFNPGANGMVNLVAIQPDSRILVGGQFSRLGGQTRNSIGRLNPDGTLDTSFNPGTDNEVQALAIQEDGRILVGGYFMSLGSQPRHSIGRLNPDGSADPTFNPGVNGGVFALAVQPDGKILVGGGFDTLGGRARANIGRLNPDGSVDTTFNPGTGASDPVVWSLIVQPDGKILVGGWFQTLGGQARSNIGRLNPDGSLDPTFNPGANDTVDSLVLQTDGKILVSGQFTTLCGQARSRIGRLNPDGSLDPDFNPGANNRVMGLAVQADGKILAGGVFSMLGGQPRSYIGQLSADTPALQTLTVDPGRTTLTWLRGGSSPEVSRVTFEQSTDARAYTLLGAGTRVPGGWQLSGLSLPATQRLYIRARGYYSTGELNGSSSVVELIRDVYSEVDLTIAIAASENPLVSGAPLTLTFTVTNRGPHPALDAALRINWPARLGAPVTLGGCTAIGQQLTCNLSDLAAGSSATISIHSVISPAANGAYPVSASVHSPTTDPVASATATLDVFAFTPLIIYDSDKDSDLSDNWSDPGVATPPCGNAAFLGEFSNQIVTLNLAKIPAHTFATVSFDLFIIRSWDGNSPVNHSGDNVGPDVFDLRPQGSAIPLLHTTFSNWDDSRQAFPSSYPGGSYPSRSGSVASNRMCYEFEGHPQDSIYHLQYSFPHTGDTLALDFSAAGLQPITDESWGLKSVVVSVDYRNTPLYLPLLFRKK